MSYKSDKKVVVTDLKGNEHTVSVANSFDLMNNLGWTAAGPKAVPSAADEAVTEAIAAESKSAMAEGKAIAEALSNKDEDGDSDVKSEDYDDAPAEKVEDDAAAPAEKVEEKQAAPKGRGRPRKE